jgi:hypothetical protein
MIYAVVIYVQQVIIVHLVRHQPYHVVILRKYHHSQVVVHMLIVYVKLDAIRLMV